MCVWEGGGGEIITRIKDQDFRWFVNVRDENFGGCVLAGKGIGWGVLYRACVCGGDDVVFVGENKKSIEKQDLKMVVIVGDEKQAARVC